MTTDNKCKAILEKIVQLCGSEDAGKKLPVISFSQDWGGNSITVEIAGKGHSHCGDPNASFDTLIDQLHRLICDNAGLSFEQ